MHTMTGSWNQQVVIVLLITFWFHNSMYPYLHIPDLLHVININLKWEKRKLIIFPNKLIPNSRWIFKCCQILLFSPFCCIHNSRLTFQLNFTTAVISQVPFSASSLTPARMNRSTVLKNHNICSDILIWLL